MTAMRVLAVALLSTLFLDGVSASAEARATALTPQQHEAALAKAATLRSRQSKRDRSAAGATVSFAAVDELRALDALSPTPQPTESPFLVIGEKMLIFTKEHATLFLIISILGILILCCPFIVIAVWCLYHDYGPAPPPYNSKKRACPPKAGIKAPLLASSAEPDLAQVGEGEQKNSKEDA